MKFGIVFPTYFSFCTKEFMLRASRRIEALGYDSIWFPDHLAIPEGGKGYLPSYEWPEPLTLAAYLAARTERLRIGWDVLVTPYRSPFLMAKSIATLDLLTEGRVIVGLGVGHLESEFRGLGIPFAKRGDITNEYIEIMQALWTKQRASYSGSTFTFADLRAEPKPFQKPHPPVWIGGNSPPALRRAARLGQGWHPMHPLPDELRRGVAAIRAARKEHRRRGPFTFSYSCPWMTLTRALLGAERTFLSGSLDQVVGDLRELKSAGCSYAVLRLGRNPKSGREMMEAVELFGKKGLPLFK